MHLCWGNYPGPHHHDVPIADIIDIVWTAKPQTVLVEGANSRHAHEWAVLKELGVPTNKKLCPGLIEPQSNYIEHPELVAQRLQRWAEVVDPERLIAGVDCGFSVHVGSTSIDPDVAFAKLGALAEGCEIASRGLRSPLALEFSIHDGTGDHSSCRAKEAIWHALSQIIPSFAVITRRFSSKQNALT